MSQFEHTGQGERGMRYVYTVLRSSSGLWGVGNPGEIDFMRGDPIGSAQFDSTEIPRKFHVSGLGHCCMECMFSSIGQLYG